MIPTQPSETANRVGMRMAAHQLLDRPLVLDDPAAMPMLDREAAARLTADPPSSSRFVFRALSERVASAGEPFVSWSTQRS